MAANGNNWAAKVLAIAAVTAGVSLVGATVNNSLSNADTNARVKSIEGNRWTEGQALTSHHELWQEIANIRVDIAHIPSVSDLSSQVTEIQIRINDIEQRLDSINSD
jgi:hypothetical protein